VFFAIVLAVLGLLYGYTGWRLIQALRLTSPWSILAWVLVAVLLVLPLATLRLRDAALPTWLHQAMAWVGYLGLGFFCLAFTLCLMRDLGWLIFRGGEALASLTGAGPIDPERRALLSRGTALAVLAASAIGTGYGWYAARHRLQVFRVEVPLAGLPPAFDGFRLVQISDLHVGLTIDRELVCRVVETVNGLAPDLIALTGDLVDGEVAHLRTEVASLAGLRAPHGAFFVTGNHEYYNDDPLAWLKEIRRLGFTVLLNEHRIVERNGARLVIAGVTDHSSGDRLEGHRSDVAAAVAGAPADLVRLLLAHQPRSIEAAARVGCHLQLSGHTHGGQFIPWTFVVPLQQPYLAGLHRHGDTWIYVNRGAGYWGPPLRLGVPAEVTELTLRCAPA
jgi:hypothetical protein